MQGYWFNPLSNIDGIKPTTGKYGMAQRCYVAKFGVGVSSRLYSLWVCGVLLFYTALKQVPAYPHAHK